MNIKEWLEKFDSLYECEELDTPICCSGLEHGCLCNKQTYRQSIKSFISEVYKEAWNEGRESVIGDEVEKRKPFWYIKVSDGIRYFHPSYRELSENEVKLIPLLYWYPDPIHLIRPFASDVITKLSELKENK